MNALNPTGNHSWSEPRFEDSIDKSRSDEIRYHCIFCFKLRIKSYDEFLMETNDSRIEPRKINNS
jgi:hypothetical protein